MRKTGGGKRKKGKEIRQKARSALAVLIASALLAAGCGAGSFDTETGKEGEAPELLEPAEEEEIWEAAKRRNLYDADVYQGNVFPDIVEYGFAVNVQFERFEVMLGDSVKKGTLLATADTEALDEEIESLQEQLKTLEEEQQEYLQDMEEQLSEPEDEAARLEDILENLKDAEPEKYEKSDSGKSEKTDVTGGDLPEAGEPALSGEYKAWAEEYKTFEGRYRILSHQNNTARLQMQQRTELYEIDHSYLTEELESLQEERKQYRITSSIDGEVVAMKLRDEVANVSLGGGRGPSIEIPQGMLEHGKKVNRGDPVIAVGNMDHKVIKCDYITNLSMELAQEIYAFAGGKKYRVNQIRTDSENSSAFEFAEEDVQIDMGEDVYLVVVNHSRENALSVPVSAVNGEKGGYYVYVKQGEESVITPVSIGMSDGVYTEILSGLSENDEVQVTSARTYGSQRSTLTTGVPESTSYFYGQLFYPTTYWVENPVTKGTVYLTEYTVEKYQQVKKGDVLARIRVEMDDIELQDYETRLKRQRERLEDLIAQGEEENKDAIEQRREEIARLEEEIADITRDGATTAIVAPRTGMVLTVPEYTEGDLLAPGADLVEIADVSDIYLVVAEAGASARYGEEDIVINYADAQGSFRTTGGKIVSMPSGGVGEELASDYALVRIPYEAAGEMLEGVAAVAEERNTAYNGEFAVELPVQKGGSMLLVPSQAVKVISGRTYVMVVEENGDIVAHGFIAAGSGNGYYWVIDGLTEGMEICLG